MASNPYMTKANKIKGKTQSESDSSSYMEKAYKIKNAQTIKPILDPINTTTPKKGGFLSSIFGDEARADYDRTHSDTPDWLKPIGFGLETFNRIPLTQRLMNKGAEFMGVDRVNFDGSKMETKSTGNKVVDGLVDVGGNLLGAAMTSGGGGKNLLNATDDISRLVGGKIAAKTGGKILPAIARGAVDGAGSIALEDISKGNIKDLPKDVAINALGGGFLVGGGQLIGDAARKVAPKVGNLLPDFTSDLYNVKTKDMLGDLVTTSSKTTQSRIKPISPQNQIFKQGDRFVGKEGLKAVSEPISIKENVLSKKDTVIPVSRIKKERLQADLPIANRDFKNVGNEKIKALQYNHPQLKPHIQQEASLLKGELLNGQRGGGGVIRNEQGLIEGGFRQPRIMSDSIEAIKDITGKSYEQIEKALDDLIADGGRENHALAKRVELIIDDRLSNGYDDAYLGDIIPPDINYLNKKEKITQQPLYRNTEINFNKLPESKNTPKLKVNYSRMESPDSDDFIKSIDGISSGDIPFEFSDDFTTPRSIDSIKVDASMLKDINDTDEFIDLSKIKDEIINMPKRKKDNPNPIDDLNLDIDRWKDKSNFSYNRETMERNLEDIAGKDADIMKSAYIEPIKVSEAKSIREKNAMRENVKEFGIKAGSKDSELMQKFGEGLISLEELKRSTPNWEKVKNGAEYMRSTYEQLIEKANTILEKNGMKPIAYRENYMPHQGEMDGIMKTLGLENYDLPTDINGLTAEFSPNKNWFGNALRRKGDITAYDAVRGFDNYIEGIQRIIHHTDNIVKLRKLEKAIRERYSDGGSTHLSNFVSVLKNYTNMLAGKKSYLDRGFEETFGRPIYRIADGIRRQVASNLIGGNISSALTNFIPLTQSLATTDKGSFIKAMIDTIGSRIKDDAFVDQSDYLVRRFGSDKLALNAWQDIQSKANWLFKVVDNFTGETVVRAKYYEGLKKGMNEKEAMNYADNFAGRVMADRSIGMTPALLNSKVTGLFAPFQTEVNNQISFLFKDLPREYAGNKIALASALGQIALYSYLFNNLYEGIVGRRPAFDPVGVAENGYKDFTNEDLPKGTAQKNLAENIANQLPFSSIVTGGRIPVGSALPDIYKLATGESDLKKEFTKPLTYLLPPTGGGQIKKTLQGLEALNNEGVYNDSKSQLKYPIDVNAANKIKGALFGPSSFDETKDYYDNGRSPLGTEQTKLLEAATGKIAPDDEMLKDIKDKGYTNKSSKEIYNSVLGDRKINKEKDKLYDLLRPLSKSEKSKAQEEANKVIKKSLSTEEKIKILKEMQEKYKATQK